MQTDLPTILAIVTVCILCIFAVFFGMFGNITHDMSSDNSQEKIDVEALSGINQLGLLYQKNEDVEKFEKQMKLMQEKQKEVASHYLGISISEAYMKEKWNFPFMEPSDVTINIPELRKPLCKIPENIPSHLQNIRQSEVFQMFAEKYSQYNIMIDISDERYHGGLVHYDFIATFDNQERTASTNFHLDSCTGEMKWSNNLSCKDTRNDERMYTTIKSEIHSSLKSEEFCNIELEPWHQSIRDYQLKISVEMDHLMEKNTDTLSDQIKLTSDLQRLGLLNNIVRHYDYGIFEPEKLQEDLKEYDKVFGSLPEELRELIENKKQLQIQKILDHCNAEGVKIQPNYKFSNATHYIDSDICSWQKDSTLIDILDRCDQIKTTGSFGGFAYGASWQNDTHSIDNNSCKWEIKK